MTPPVGCVWDADRLDAVHLGASVDQTLPSTAVARRLVAIREGHGTGKKRWTESNIRHQQTERSAPCPMKLPPYPLAKS